MMPHHLNSTWEPTFLAALRFGKARTQLLCKDHQGKTVSDGAWDQGRRGHYLMMSYFRAGRQVRNLHPKQSVRSKPEGTSLTVHGRPWRLATKSRPGPEVGLLESANPWAFGECLVCLEQWIN